MSDTNADAVALQGTSIESFLSSLVVNFVTAGIFLFIFISLRTQLHRIYEPRSYMSNLPAEKQTTRLPRTPWGWFLTVMGNFRHQHILIEKSGLDAYFFIRYLRMVLIIFIPALCLTWPILLPINYIGGVDNNPVANQTSVTGLDRFGFGNVSRTHIDRYWAHLILAYIFVAWIFLVVTVEMIHFIKMRQQWLVSARHRAKASATTILVTTIPGSLLHEDKIRRLFSALPGGVKNVWLNRDYSSLLNQIDQRDSIAHRLELAELNLLQRAYKAHEKKMVHEEKDDQAVHSNPFEAGAEGQTRADAFLTRNERPQHRLPLAKWFIGLPNWTKIGQRVDTIEWCKIELARMNVEIEGKQSDPGQYKALNSAFIQFHRQIAAHMAVQSVSHRNVKQMSPRYLEVSPKDVIWNNMQLRWWERYIWVVIVWVIAIAFTVFFAVPTAFIGSLSHVTDLIAIFPWLGFLNTNSSGAKFWSGLVTGVLPPALVGLLLLLVPILMKLLVRLQGHPTKKELSLTVQNMYFTFLFIQLFLVITISSGITALISAAIKDLTSIPQLLATNLPKASNFFFAYLLQQGLSVSSGDLAQVWWLFVHYVATSLTSTPRSKWSRWNNLRFNTWGTTYPSFTNLAAIGIVYSIITPLIMIFVIIAFLLFGVAELTNFMYVYDPVTDTGGLSFPQAIQQLFVGVYFMELCLTGLFFLVRNVDGGGVPCKIQAILTIVLIILTGIFQILLYRNFHPLVQFLPLTDRLESDDSTDGAPLLAESESPEESDQASRTTSQRSLRKSSRQPGADDIEGQNEAQTQIDAQAADDELSPSARDALLLKAFKHEALRRRRPIIWIPQDKLGIAADEISRMPEHVPASMSGATLNEKGKAEYSCDPPDYVRTDNAVL